MKQLWAPWRLSYILDKVKRESERDCGCFLCIDSDESKDEDSFVLYRGEHCFAVMNIYPYNNGHLMVAPLRHVTALEEMNDGETYELFTLSKLCVTVMNKAISPNGFNIGMNVGKIAGAGEEHIHLHIVPRWAGDTNFMPILADVKVVPVHIEETYAKLRDGLRKHVASC